MEIKKQSSKPPVQEKVQKVVDDTKNFLNDSDVKASNDALSSAGMNLTIEKGRTPVYFLSATYADGYVHWVGGGGGKSKFRVVCGGGLAGKGYAPDSCKICKWMSEIYDKSTQIQSSGKPKQAQVIRNTANAVHAKYELLFVVAKGEMLVTKDKTGKKVDMPDFDECEVGTLSMTKKQWQDFQGLVDAGRYDQIESKKDLFNRIIVVDKRNRSNDGKKDLFPTIEFIPSKKQSDAPVEVDLKDYPLGERFIVSTQTLDEVAQMLRHGKVKKDDAEYEDEEALDDYLDDDDADTAEDDTTDTEAEDTEADDAPEEDGDEFDDSFLSEDEAEEDEDEPAPKKAPVKSRPGQPQGHPGRKIPPRRKADF